jgi:folate-binding protein YgfZ
VQGTEALAILQASLAGPIADQGYQEIAGVHVLRRDRTGVGGWDLLVEPQGITAIRDALVAAGAVLGTEQQLLAERVHAGHPAWPVDRSGERTFVHELRLRDVVCNFDKGCYLGQEVINRMETMGRLTKQIQGLRIDGDTPPPVGTPIHLDGKAMGTLGSAALVDGRVEALAVLRKKAWQEGTQVILGTGADTWTGTVSVLPFD